MKNILERTKLLPIVSSTQNGKIMYMNVKAKSAFPNITIGESILPKVDEKAFYKNTMYRNKLDIIDTKDKNHKNAIIKVFTKYIIKMVELIFLDNEYFENSENKKNIKKMFLIFTENLSQISKNADIQKITQNIVEMILSTKNFSHKRLNVKCDEEIISNLKVSLFEVITISIIFLLNEIDFCAPVSINLQKANEFIDIKFIQNIRLQHSVKDMQSFSNIYPHTLPRIEFINSLCERENIVVTAEKKDDSLIISAKMQIPKAKEEILRAHSFDEESMRRTNRYISLISYVKSDSTSTI